MLTPTASDKPDQCRGAIAKPMEKVNAPFAVAALRHCRPSRPRPALWCSATSNTDARWPERARRISSELVESMCATTSTEKPGSHGAAACSIARTGQPAAHTPQRPRRLGASKVPRQPWAPHQQGYSAFSFGV